MNIQKHNALNFVCTALPGPGNECVFVELENDSGESLGYGEWRHRDDGLVELHIAVPQPIYDEEKERELFEVYYRAEFEANSGNELSDADIKSMRDGPWYGESRHYLNGQWAGWKACAQSRAKAGEETP